jgi:hypothetical protein
LKKEEHMRDIPTKKGESMIMEGQLMKWLGHSTKNLGSSTQALTEMMVEEHGKSGAQGDYTITETNGKQVTITGATAIRVLDHGELNLVTDTGRWYLFAPNAWKTACPREPEPGNSDGK